MYYRKTKVWNHFCTFYIFKCHPQPDCETAAPILPLDPTHSWNEPKNKNLPRAAKHWHVWLLTRHGCPCFTARAVPCKRFHFAFIYLFKLLLQGQLSSGKGTRFLALETQVLCLSKERLLAKLTLAHYFTSVHHNFMLQMPSPGGAQLLDGVICPSSSAARVPSAGKTLHLLPSEYCHSKLLLLVLHLFSNSPWIGSCYFLAMPLALPLAQTDTQSTQSVKWWFEESDWLLGQSLA